ncbi:MATE family efflux transporter [Phragmitibacter flavus]|uniref:Multidrug-efflux transporter n=1 Tax=Phragmitibacter flavus TaxID=2576071 RepID=A0A5R8K9K8_9BACT|nr:MATE family efflux transporter [Phragmitibacter flavus]TLD69022.1 MATE family efflux transporter [Phragmitibacter flavus]
MSLSHHQNQKFESPLPSLATESRLTFRLALPLIIGQLSQMLLGLADTIMIGKLGVPHLGASTIATNLLIVPLMLGFGLLSSISVRVSQAHGANQPDEAAKALRHGTWLALAFGLLAALGSIAIVPFLSSMRQPEEVVFLVPTFLITCGISIIPALLGMAWKSHADALNRPWIPFWIQLGGVLLNILLNWILIWGKLGLPAFGLEGAGYATLLSRIITAVLMFQWLTRAAFAKPWLPKRWLAPCDIATFKNLLIIGIPASLHLLTEVGAFSACTLMIGTLGAIPLAAHQVALNCASTTFMIPLGVGMAMTVRVGEIVGSGLPHEHARLRRVLLSGWLFAVGFMILSMLMFFFYGAWIAHQFVADSEVVRLAAKLLIIAAIFQMADGFQVVSVFALRGINDVKVPARMVFVAYWLIAIPLGLWFGLHKQWGVEGIWWPLALGLGIAAVVLGRRAWRKLISSTPRPN